MDIQTRILKFVTTSNWVIFAVACILGLCFTPFDFAKGIFFGGLIVTVNFHLLYRTLKKALTPPALSTHNAILAKYYIRFAVSGFIIFLLIKFNIVNPLGLLIGLSVVVAGIMLATMREFKKLIFKEAM